MTVLAEQPELGLFEPPVAPAPDAVTASAASAAGTPDGSQQQVLDHDRGLLRVLGGVGTGKTRSLTLASARACQDFGVSNVVALVRSRQARETWETQVVRSGGRAAPRVHTVHSLAYELINANGPAPRLLTAAEQETMLREIIGESTRQGTVPWGEHRRAAVESGAFVARVRRAIARIRGLGLDPHTVTGWAQAQGDDFWTGTAAVAAQYLDVLDWEAVVDYPELLLRASDLLADGDPFAAVFVDDAHELEPMGWQMVRHLTGRAIRAVVAGDPNQNIVRFLGADVAPLSATRMASSATVLLTTTYAMSPAVRDHCERIAGSTVPIGPTLAEHRGLVCPAVPESVPAGSVLWEQAADEGAALAAITGWVMEQRRRGRNWSDLAVLVPNGDWVAMVGRELANAGVRAPAEAQPWADNPVSQVLHEAARLALAGLTGSALSKVIRSLLVSDWIGLSARGVRRLDRWLRVTGGTYADLWESIPEQAPTADISLALRCIERLRTACRRAADAQEAGAEFVLWTLWDATINPEAGRWPTRLEAISATGRPEARLARLDLLAAASLFRAVARVEDRWSGRRATLALLDELATQEVPLEVDRVVARADSATVAVCTVTAARSSRWASVLIVDPCADPWPGSTNSITSTSPLRLTPDGLTQPSAARPGELRRFFHVACTRAREDLGILSLGDTWRPELTGDLRPASRAEESVRTLPGLVLNLRERAAAQCPDAAAVADLAYLARHIAILGSAVLSAPDRWPGARNWTKGAEQPARELAISPSGLATLHECAQRWFLERRARGNPRRDTRATRTGTMVHEALAAYVKGEPKSDILDRVERDPLWPELAVESDWVAEVERERVLSALERGWNWIDTRSGELHAETQVSATWHENEFTVNLHGSIDLLEISAADDESREQGPSAAIAWDYKTSRSRMSSQQLIEHVQIAAYRAMVLTPGADGLIPAVPEVQQATAGIVQVGVGAGARDPLHPAVMAQTPEQADEILEAAKRSVGATVLHQRYPASPGPRCRSCPVRNACVIRGRA